MGFPRPPADRDVELTVMQFTYDKRPLRVVMLDDEPWFVAMDLCRLLHLNLMPATKMVEPEDLLRVPRGYVTAGKMALHTTNDHHVLFIAELGFHDLVPRSFAADARAIKRWVTREVLPTIRSLALPTVHRTDLPMVRRQAMLSNKRGGLDKPHALYRFYDPAGALLYVGITWQVENRMPKHRAKAKWWHEVASVQFEHFPDRASAEAAETTAIRSENPRHNIQKRVS